MLIKSKKGGREHEVTPSQWAAMQSNGLHRNFRVISEDDAPAVTTVTFSPPELGAKQEAEAKVEKPKGSRQALKKKDTPAE